MPKSFLILESQFFRNCWVRCFRWYQTGLGVNLNLPSSFFGWSLPFCPSLHLVSWKVVPYFRKSSLIFIVYPRLHCLQTIPFTAVYLPPPPLPGLLIGTLRCHNGEVNGNRLNRQNNNFCTCVTLFSTFLYSHCTTRTGKCLISRFIEDVNKRRLNFLSLSEHGF